MFTKTGVDEWLAPEIIDGVPYDEKVDLWSAGCVLYFMLTGYKPFENPNMAKLHHLIRTGKVNFEEANISSDCQ